MGTRRIGSHERKRARPLPSGPLAERIAAGWKLILLTALFTAGMAFGAVLVKSSANHEWLEKLLNLLQEYSIMRSSQSLFSTMCNSLFANLLFLAVAFIAGLCAMGLPFLALLPFVRGLGMGAVFGYLYSAKALAGVGYCLLILLPGAILSTATLLIGCREGITMSFDVFSVINGKKTLDGYHNFRLYCIRFGILLALLACASLADALFAKAFSGFFHF